MGYRVKGTLKLPDGSPASNAEIEFISRKNFSPLVRELKSNILCGPAGAYDVTLEFGEYAVMVYPGGTYPAALGTITLASDTAAGQDLPTLLQQSGWQPATPEYIQQITAWLAEANAGATSSAASASAAKVSETNAKSSENAALSSKNSAASSASTATTKATEAASSASAALASKNAAATSETNALSSKNAAAASASTATSAASSATSSASAAAVSESTSLSAATRAEQAAQTVTGALIDTGPYNAASGVLPTPSMSSGVKRSSIWKVTGSGTAGGIELSIGDSLVYTASDSSYYKIDNTESFSELIQAVAIPLPDVSIPFTTDGQMLHGKGEEARIGSTVVANFVAYERLGSQTMIDKSGRLVTVPAGEMSIEQQGVAIFDRSVNLTAPSINWAASANAASPWVHGAKDEFGWISVSGSGDPSKTEGSYKDFSVPTADTPHTLSLDILKAAGLNVKLRTYGTATGTTVDVTITETAVSGSGASGVYDMGHCWRVELTRAFSVTTRLFRIYPFGLNTGSAGAMSYRRVQLEAKPFATPYIENETSAQTARPATTRCDIPWRGNMLPISDNQQFTIALEFDTAGIPLVGISHTLFTQGGGFGHQVMARVENGGLLRFYRSAGATHQPSVSSRRRYRICFRVNRNVCDLFVDGVKSGSTATAMPVANGLPDVLRLGHSLTPDRCLNGHLRSISIWNTPLTDIQCQAASS